MIFYNFPIIFYILLKKVVVFAACFAYAAAGVVHPTALAAAPAAVAAYANSPLYAAGGSQQIDVRHNYDGTLSSYTTTPFAYTSPVSSRYVAGAPAAYAAPATFAAPAAAPATFAPATYAAPAAYASPAAYAAPATFAAPARYVAPAGVASPFAVASPYTAQYGAYAAPFAAAPAKLFV
ncbi:cuticle protein 12.5-like [Lucilia sericata]|uniref:cuticle protein 12.5-like n=1 Tax=Lucilia sericata TaxID=13632 RepID=UPI0018A817A2|nr:cuticle protein 12.5-like [Lucilia sericata]